VDAHGDPLSFESNSASTAQGLMDPRTTRHEQEAAGVPETVVMTVEVRLRDR
jgi:hypothetical protein